MQNLPMQQYKAIAALLQATKEGVNNLLSAPEDELHRLNITQQLQQLSDRLLLITGAGDMGQTQTTVLGPAKTIGGKPIGKLPRITERDLRPSDDKVLALKDQVEAALQYFNPKASSEGILANIPDIVIRGVAKKAGMKVTKDEPKEITVEFIEEIKAALLAAGERIETGDKLTMADVEKLAEAIAAPVKTTPDGGVTTATDGEAKSTPGETIAPVDETKAANKETATEEQLGKEFQDQLLKGTFSNPGVESKDKPAAELKPEEKTKADDGKPKETDTKKKPSK